jgi:hypothetical protein
MTQAAAIKMICKKRDEGKQAKHKTGIQTMSQNETHQTIP